VPAGDAALVLEFDERIDVAINRQVVGVARSVRAAAIPGVRDVVPTYRSVTVYFDPLKTNHDALIEMLESQAGQSPDATDLERPAVRLPVCYGGELGPDLEQVAAFAKLPEGEVVALHAGTTYRVFMLGFVPGFAYMGIVDPRIAMQRRGTPRTRVPRGSVAIAGAQTGIYPSDTPGGWQLVGRTPVKPYDPARADPFLLHPGDAVQFFPIERAEFDRMIDAESAPSVK
jgi:inhibitor of KinA